MKKNLYFIFIAASFSVLVFSPGRLAYGIPLIVEMLFLTAGATAFGLLLKKLALNNLNEILTLSFIIFLTVLYKQILILFCPVLALTLSFVMYLPPVSVFLLSAVFTPQTNQLKNNMRASGFFSAFAFLFFLLRDILGYGTLSFPLRNSIAEKYLFDSEASSFFAFFASIPGALLLLVFCMALILTVQIKMNIIEKSGAQDDGN